MEIILGTYLGPNASHVLLCTYKCVVWGERSISSLSTKGPRRFYRVLKGVVAALAAVSGMMAKLVVSEKGTTKSFGPLPSPHLPSANVLLLSYVAHTKREAIFLICFASLSELSTPHH